MAIRDISTLLARCPSLLNSLARDYRAVCSSWSYWEAGNGYPTKDRRIGLHEIMNHLDEGGHLNRLQVINFVHTVTALGRMMDVVKEKRGENRLSLEALSLILDREDLDLRDVSRQNGLQAEHADRLRDQLATLIVCETSEKSIKKLRPRFKKMRDEMIAHSLENPSESEINVFLVRDAIVTCGYATMLAKLLFLGENWDPKIVWRNSIQTAQAFWDRHQSGYAVFTPSQKSL